MSRVRCTRRFRFRRIWRRWRLARWRGVTGGATSAADLALPLSPLSESSAARLSSAEQAERFGNTRRKRLENAGFTQVIK